MKEHEDMAADDSARVEPEPISRELDDMANALIDRCLDLLAEEGTLPVSLAVADAKGNEVLVVLEDEDLEECIDEVRNQLEQAVKRKASIEGLKGVPVRYAFGYEGAVSDQEDGEYKPALIIEYGETGMSCAYSAYMLYQNAGDPQRFVWTDPAAAGEGPLLV